MGGKTKFNGLKKKKKKEGLLKAEHSGIESMDNITKLRNINGNCIVNSIAFQSMLYSFITVSKFSVEFRNSRDEVVNDWKYVQPILKFREIS